MQLAHEALGERIIDGARRRHDALSARGEEGRREARQTQTYRAIILMDAPASAEAEVVRLEAELRAAKVGILALGLMPLPTEISCFCTARLVSALAGAAAASAAVGAAVAAEASTIGAAVVSVALASLEMPAPTVKARPQARPISSFLRVFCMAKNLRKRRR